VRETDDPPLAARPTANSVPPLERNRVAFLTIVRFILLLVEFRRREEPLWIAKWVKRSENQRFLVTHQRPINILMILTSSSILLAYVIRLHEVSCSCSSFAELPPKSS
jgi:hypothetical protein